MINQKLFFLLLGVIIGAATYFFIDFFAFKVSDTLATSDVIDIASIIVNVVIGIALVLMIQKKISDDRGVKDYFLKEVSEITDEYRKFNNSFIKGKLEARWTVEWFKVIAVRIKHLETFLSKDLKIEDRSMRASHRDIQICITNTTEFNNSFKAKFYIPATKTKTRALELYREFQTAAIHVIIRINRA